MQTLDLNRYLLARATGDPSDAAWMLLGDVHASGEIVARFDRAEKIRGEKMGFVVQAKDIRAAALTPDGQIAVLCPIFGHGATADVAISNLFDQWVVFEQSIPESTREGMNTCLAVGLHPPYALFQFVTLA